VTGFWKNKSSASECISPKAGPGQPAATRGHYILYTTFVSFDHYFVIYFRKESPVPRNRPLCHAGMDVARVLPIHPRILLVSHIYFTQIVLELYPNLNLVASLQ
jgi:hypothetical protein